MTSPPPQEREQLLAVLVEQACETWSDLDLDREAFVQYLGERLPTAGALSGESAKINIHADDLYLAFGCANGHARAIRQFERQYGQDIDQVSRRFTRLCSSTSDLRQVLLEKLFVARDSRLPKIADYSGRGHLQNWLRVTAVRTFLDVTRHQRRQSMEQFAEGRSLQDVADELDPELDFLKKRYRLEFKTAFAKAVASLSSGERNLLRHQVLAGLNVDQIAAIYHIHRATAARRLVRTRKALLVATRKELMQRLSVDRDELESIMNLISSNLDASVHRILLSHPSYGKNPLDLGNE